MGDEAGNNNNYTSCCRLCLSRQQQFVPLKPIFVNNGASGDDDEESNDLAHRILTFLGIEIAQTDKLSTMICDPCREKVNSFDEYKRTCTENQKKLKRWMGSSGGTPIFIDGEMPIQIKVEPVDREQTRLDTADLLIIKSEPFEIDEEYYDDPPVLSPQSVVEDIQVTAEHLNIINDEESIGEVSQNGSIPPSLDSEDLSESEKIRFAAGLRLKSKADGRNDDPAPLSKLEEAYIEKNKALVSMLFSSRCACHNMHYDTVKRLFGHLRANYNWFPIFTCYNCLITFNARSGLMKHCGKCPKPYLENCIRLAQLKKRSAVKFRLYQYYKCASCEMYFAFWDDYQDHVNAEHLNELRCKCSEFQTKDELRKHLYDESGCNLHFYCEVCYNVFEDLNGFKEHCLEHDKQEHVFVEYRNDFKLVEPLEILRSRKRKYPDESDEGEMSYLNLSINQSANRIDLERNDLNRSNANRSDLNTTDMNRSDSNRSSVDRSFMLSAKEIKEEGDNINYNLRSPRRRKSRMNGWKNDPTKCLSCDKEFSTYYNMIRHMKTHEESEKHIQCSHCEEKFRLVSELKDHLNTVHGETHVCPECCKRFETSKQLEKHRAVHLNIKVYRNSDDSYRTTSRFVCEECNLVFDTESSLKAHMPTHGHFIKQETASLTETDDEDRRKFSCDDCDRHYLSSKGLWLHNKRHHPELVKTTNQSNFECDVCDKVCSTNAAYQQHKAMHMRNMAMLKPLNKMEPSKNKNDEDDDYFTCKKCFKVFSTKYNLKTHLKTHGLTINSRSISKTKATKTFWCDVCHQACQGYSELQKHKLEHVNENVDTDSQEIDVKPNIKTCELCSKIFITNLGYVKHKLKHERTKGAFSCKYCNMPFTSSQSFYEHVQEYHQGDSSKRPKFTCNICNKSFESSGALCSHQGWHKRTSNMLLSAKERGKKEVRYSEPGFRPKNTCKNCGLSFATDTALQIHILEVHRNVNATLVTPKCTTCQLEFTSNEAYDEHQKLHALPQVSFKCKYCPRTFPKCAAFNAHINTVHHPVTDGRIKCHECNRFFEKNNALAMHLKVHDRQKLALATNTPIVVKEVVKKVFSCSICFASFEIAKDLRNHIITTHPF